MAAAAKERSEAWAATSQTLGIRASPSPSLAVHFHHI